MRSRNPTIAIAGGGIGGLTCALANAKFGIASVVFEQHASSEDVGAGIQLSPNATKCLGGFLGLAKELTAIARRPAHMQWRDGTNDYTLALFRMGQEISDRFGASFLQFSRPELVQCLEQACQYSDLIDVRKGECIEQLEFSNSKTAVHTSRGVYEVDICVGADGSHSTIRQYHHSSPDKVSSAGSAYRTTLPVNVTELTHFTTSTILWLHHDFHVVVYPIGMPRVLNCVFVVESQDFEQHPDLHRQLATKAELAERLTQCSPTVSSLIDAIPTDDLFRWQLYQFAPLRRDHAVKHPVALIGDAWHTSFPFAGQGAALAIEDAIVLARFLANAEAGSYLSRLTRFEQARIPRIRTVQAISNRNRWIYHLRNRGLKWVRDRIANRGFKRTAQTLFGYDATSV